MADGQVEGNGAGNRPGRDLAGGDFSGHDLRGADFTGANLRGANFRAARVGVPVHIGVVIIALGLIVAVICGLAIGWSVDEMRTRASSDEWDEIAEGGTLFATVLLLLGLTIWKGVDVAVRFTFAFYAVIVVIIVGANLLWEEVEWFVLLRATALVVFVTLAILAGVVGRVVGGVFGTWSIVLVAMLGGLATGQAEGGIAGIMVALSLAFVSRRTVRGDERDRRIRLTGHRLVRRWGTRFVGADLTGADFTGTDPRSCDMRGALLDDVIWDRGHPPPLDAGVGRPASS